jgi:hypothetical protein
VVLSLVLGALTHVIWDSLTHAKGWAVASVPILRTPISLGSGPQVPLFHVLQHASTAVGIVVLCLAYLKWLRGTAPKPDAQDRNDDRWRSRLLGALALASLVAAAPFAYVASLSPSATFQFQPFVFRFVVFATASFACVVVVAALLVARRKDAV